MSIDSPSKKVASNDDERTAPRAMASRSTEPVKGTSVSRVLEILEAVASADRPLTPSELNDSLDIPKATMHRLCAVLEEKGFLQARMGGRGLLPGKRFHRIALGVLASSPFRAQRHAILTHLSEELGETCNISIPDGSSMIYFDRAETHWPVRVQLQIGSRVPVYSTAAGKMFLSTLPVAKQHRILSNTTLLRKTPNTLVHVDDLMQELELTRERGYALDSEEYVEGMVAIAVPLTDMQQRLYATLSVHAPCMRVSLDELVGYLSKLRYSASQLEQLLEE